MSAGRPSKYNEETIPKTLGYIENYEDEGDAIPSVAGLACFLKVSRETIYDWSKQDDKKEFSDILQTLLATQEKILVNKGLKSEFNSNITKLALGKHGYHESSKVEHSGGTTVVLDSKDADMG